MATDYNLADPLRYGAVRRRNAEFDAQDRRKRLAEAGVNEAMEFIRPKPMIITADEGKIPDSAFRGPDFSNVQAQANSTRDGKKLVAGEDNGSFRRRNGARATAAPGSSVQAPNLGNDPTSEAERKQRLSEVNSAIADVQFRGGGLNMASKRRLYGDLIGQKNDLTSEAYRGQTQRDLERARLQGDASKASAGLAEDAAKRRDTMSMFYDEQDEGARQSDNELAIKRASAKSQDSYLDELIKDAKAQRDSDKYALQRRGVQDEADYGRVDKMAAELIAAGVPAAEARSQARQSLTLDLDDTNQAIDTTPTVAGAKDYISGVGRKLSQDRSFLDKIDQGDNPFTAAPAVDASSYPLDKLQVSPTGFAPGDLVDWAIPGYAVPDYQVTGPSINGQRVKQTFGTQQEAADTLKEIQRAARLRDKTKRKTGP